MNFTYRLYRFTNKVREKVGYRTLKTAVATPLSMAIAQSLGVNNVATAGILTMLCIQPSRKRSFQTATDRFLACLLAIAFSAAFFEVFGYSAVVLSVLLMVFIPTTIFFKIESGIFTSTVITLNIYLFESFNLDFISNQLYLIIIGIGTGFIVNLYMPSLDKKLENLKKSLEVRFLIIFRQISKLLKKEETQWLRTEIGELEKIFDEANELAKRDRENQIHGTNHSYSEYFQMRRQQFRLLQEMLNIIDRLPKKDKVNKDIVAFIDKLGEAIHTNDTARAFMKELQVLKENFKQVELPKTYQDFEAKSVTFQLLQEIERYLSVKVNLMEPEEKPTKQIQNQSKSEI